MSGSKLALASRPRPALPWTPLLLLALACACLNPAISDEQPISETMAAQLGADAGALDDDLDPGASFDDPDRADPSALEEPDDSRPVLVLEPSETPSRGRRRPGVRGSRR